MSEKLAVFIIGVGKLNAPSTPYYKILESKYLDIEIIIAPFLKSRIEGRIEFVTSTFLYLQKKKANISKPKSTDIFFFILFYFFIL
jgi:hypothetical protein